MNTKQITRLILGLGLIAALAGCIQVYDEGTGTGTTSTNTAPTTMGSSTTSGEPVEVGVLFPLSGEAAGYGLAGQRVLDIAAKEINDAGGITGRPVKLEYEDGGCDADVASKAISSLVSVKKVKVIIGGLCSSETLTSAPVVERSQVVLLSPGSSNQEITKSGDYIFRNYPSDNAQGSALADYANTKGYKKVGILTEEQPFPEGIAVAFKETFVKLGGETVIEKFAKDASDFRTQITKLSAAKVDVFFVNPQAPAKGDIILKQLLEAGEKGPFFMNDVVIGAQKEIIEKYKDQLEGSIGALVPYDKTNTKLATLEAAYKAVSGGDEIPYKPYMLPTYDALYIFKEAIEKVGEDPVKIKDYLYTIKGRKGLAGTLTFDANGDPDSSFRHALQVVKGGVVQDYSAETMKK